MNPTTSSPTVRTTAPSPARRMAVSSTTIVAAAKTAETTGTTAKDRSSAGTTVKGAVSSVASGVGSSDRAAGPWAGSRVSVMARWNRARASKPTTWTSRTSH